MDKILALLKGKVVAIGVAIVGVAVVTGAVVAGPKGVLGIPQKLSGQELASQLNKKEIPESMEAEYVPPVLADYMSVKIKAFEDPKKVNSIHVAFKNFSMDVGKNKKKVNMFLDILGTNKPFELYVRFKIDGLNKDELSKAMKLEGSSASMILPFINGTKWISLTESDIKQMSSMFGESASDISEQLNSRAQELSKEDRIKFSTYVFNCFDIKSKNVAGRQTIELSLNKEKAIVSLTALKKDTELLKKVGLTTAGVEKYLDAVKKAGDEYSNFVMIYIYTKNGRVSEIKGYMPFTVKDEEKWQKTISKLESGNKNESAEERKIREALLKYLKDAKQNKRIFLGTLAINYKSVKPDTVPSGKDVVSFMNFFGPFIMMYMNPGMQTPQTPGGIDNTYPGMNNNMYNQDMYKNMPY